MKRHRPRRRRITNRRPNRQKTIEDLTRLEGNEYYQTPDGITLRLEDIGYNHMITMSQLLAKFYRINEGQRPLVIHLTEEPGSIIQGDKIYQIVMRGNFYLRIEPNKERFGPHRCQLWFKSFTDKKQHWLASCQLMAFFFNEKEIDQAIRTAVDQKEFFMLPQNADIPILP